MGTFNINIQAKSNVLPVANAGSNQSISLPTSTATLDGSASYDPDGTIVSYAWTQLSGPPSTISSSSSATTGVTGMTAAGNYVYQLTVTDNNGGTNSATVTKTITSLPTYSFKWVVDPSSGSCATDGGGHNTGYKQYGYLLKVTNDSNQYALDANNNLTSSSGLPQDRKANSSSDADYVAPVSSPDCATSYSTLYKTGSVSTVCTASPSVAGYVPTGQTRYISGTQIFTDAALTMPMPTGYYADSDSKLHVTNGVVDDVHYCSSGG